MLGAAIVLPDHPQIAPESRGNLFDNTEIEEALVLHVQALSDEERAQLEHQDPAVREMIERARAVTPEELLRLHGRVEVRDPVTREPPQPSADVRDPTRGLPEVEVDGVTSSAAAGRWWCVPGSRRTCRRACSRAGRSRSSGSTATTTTRCTSA